MTEHKEIKALEMREVIASAIRVAIARAGLDHARLAMRMSALGCDSWRRQTVGAVVSGKRRVSGEELFPLSLALECAMSDLVTPGDPAHRRTAISLPNGRRVPAVDVQFSAGVGHASAFVYWEGDRVRFAANRFVDEWSEKLDAELNAQRIAARRSAEFRVPPMDVDAVAEPTLRVMHALREHLAQQGIPLDVDADQLDQMTLQVVREELGESDES